MEWIMMYRPGCRLKYPLTRPRKIRSDYTGARVS